MPDDALPRMVATGEDAGCYSRFDFEPIRHMCKCDVWSREDLVFLLSYYTVEEKTVI